MSTDKARYRCCGSLPQTWAALTIFALTVIFMSLMQLYADSLPNYEPLELQDFGFKVIPYLGDTFKWMNMSFWDSLADVWVAISLFIYVVLNVLKYRKKDKNGKNVWIPLFYDRQLAFRRFLLIISLVYFCRALTIADTRYPGLVHSPDRYKPTVWIWGALLMMEGVRATGTDFMFSGHTALWIVTASMVSKYTDYKWGAVVYWIFNGVGIVSLLALEEHYLADIVVSIIISKLVYWAYHLFFEWPLDKEALKQDVKQRGVVGFYARFYKNMLWLDGNRYK